MKNYSFLKWNENTSRLLQISGGTPSFKIISNKLENPEKLSKKFKNKKISRKIIYILDSDKAGLDAKKSLIKSHKLIKKSDLIYNNNCFYLLMLSSKRNVEIEDLYPDYLKEIELDNKVFNADDNSRGNFEYGKKVFAEKIVPINAKPSDFSGFNDLLNSLQKILDNKI